MKSASALSRNSQQVNAIPGVPVDVAKHIAQAWQNIVACEYALVQAPGVVAWRACPSEQNLMAAALSGALDGDTHVMCVGFQAYAWMAAVGTSVQDIVRVQLGKKLPEHVFSCTADDAASMLPKTPAIVAIHIENADDWQQVRAISAAAVKANTPLLVLASAGVAAPQGGAIESFNDFASTAAAVRNAWQVVCEKGAIRVIAISEVQGLERVMMEAAQVTPEAWQEGIQKNNDGAEVAVSSAYQSPVESF